MQLWKLEAEQHDPLKQMRETTITVQNVNVVVGIPEDVCLKAKMFDAELKMWATFLRRRWLPLSWIKKIRWTHP